MFRNINCKVVALVGATCLIFAVGAYAYWTQGGSGNGTAANGSNGDIVITQTAITGLYPGGAPVGLSGTFDNPNANAVFVDSVTASLVSVTGSVGTPACTIADYQLASPVATVNLTIPSGLAQGAWSGPTIRLIDSATNQNACKNATVNLHYTSN